MQNLKRPAADFERAFTNGSRFEDEDDWQYEMEVLHLGELCLPTGVIVAEDPGCFSFNEKSDFEQTVPPGTYPVDLAVCHIKQPNGKQNVRVACMRVRFQDCPVAEWTMATRAGQNPDKLLPFQMYGHGVDRGISAFADANELREVEQIYKKRGETLLDEFYDEQLIPAIGENLPQYANIPLDPSTQANLVICSSGWGDGVYASYWGFDAEGKPVCLITDFGLLVNHIEKERELGRLADLLGKERFLRFPRRMLGLRIDQLTRRKLRVQMSGSGRGICEIEFRREGKTLSESSYTVTLEDNKQTRERIFSKFLTDDVTVVVKYLDRIESVKFL